MLILERLAEYNPLNYLNNPFKDIIGSRLAPHAPTLNSGLKEKFNKSRKVFGRLLTNFIGLPIGWTRATLGLVQDIINAIPVVNYVLTPVTVVLEGVRSLLESAKYAAHDIIDVASYFLALAVSPITFIVNIGSSIAYYAKIESINGMSVKEIKGHASGSKTLGAYDKSDIDNVYLVEDNNASNTSKICFALKTVSFGKRTRDRLETDSVDLEKAVNNPTTPTEVAVSNAIQLDKYGMAAEVERVLYPDDNYRNSYSYNSI